MIRNFAFALTSLAIVGALAAQERLGVPPKPVEAAPTPDVIQHWIGQLADKDERARAAAARQLTETEAAVPALRRAALVHRDSPAGKQIEAILLRHKEKAYARFDQEFAAMVKAREVDRMIDALACWRERVGKDRRDAVAQLSQELVSRSEQCTKQKRPVVKQPELYFFINGAEHLNTKEIVPLVKDQFPREEGAWAWFGGGNCDHAFAVARTFWSEQNVFNCTLVGRDSLRLQSLAHNCYLLCNSEIDVDHLAKSFVFVSGNLHAGEIRNSVVLAVGDIQVGNSVVNSTLIAQGEINIAKKDTDSASTIMAKEKKFFENATLFDPAKLGMDAKYDSGNVRVMRVSADTPMSRAGVRAGDIVRSIDDDPVSGIADLRTYLRRKSVEFLPFFLTVERDGKTIELVVPSK
jgi:hypothetical protein